MKSLGIVEWACGRGCTRGQPYGEHGDCGMRVVKTLGDYPDTDDRSPKYPTPRSALEAGVKGHNIRCNFCGSWGATWVHKMRPGWGDLAMCPRHERMLEMEMTRHREVLDQLQTINFEQDLSAFEVALEEWAKERRAQRKEQEAYEKEQRRLAREARAAERAASEQARQEAVPTHGIFEQGSADRQSR